MIVEEGEDTIQREGGLQEQKPGCPSIFSFCHVQNNK